MKIKQTKNSGRTFRVANGQEVPNQGETKIKGQSDEGQAMLVTAQAAEITKPLAAANDMVDADNFVIMHKDGGVIQKLNEDEKKAIMKIIEGSKGPSVPTKRKGGAFVIEIHVMKDPEEGFSPAKKIFKPKNIKLNKTHRLKVANVLPLCPRRLPNAPAINQRHILVKVFCNHHAASVA